MSLCRTNFKLSTLDGLRFSDGSYGEEARVLGHPSEQMRWMEGRALDGRKGGELHSYHQMELEGREESVEIEAITFRILFTEDGQDGGVIAG